MSQLSRGYAGQVEVAVNIPDDLFKQAESVASEQRITRSELYARALESLLASNGPSDTSSAPPHPAWLAFSDEEITRNLNEHAAKHDPKLDPGLAEAQFRTLLKHWEWEE